MNNNIFSAKGTINQSFFIIYYILLITLYIIGGIALMLIVSKNNWNLLYFILPLFFIKVLIVFNYKKRLFDYSRNLPLSIFWAILLSFDTESLVVCQLIKSAKISMVVFFAMATFILFVQPAIVTILPSRKQNKIK